MDARSATTILVVEDESLIRMDLVHTLEEMGFAVLEASSADEAIAILEMEPAIVAVVNVRRRFTR